jgi:tetratricopeptide (TPR) repeat protein
VTDESDSSYPSEAEKSLIEIVDSAEVNEVQQIEIEQEDILELIQDLPNIPVFDLPDDIVEQYQEEMEITSVIEPDMDQQESEEGHIEKDKSLMVMMSFTDWLNHFKQKNTAEQEEDRSKKALKAVWQKEKLAEAADEELDEIPEPIFKQAMDSISSESDLVSETLADLHARQGNIEKAIAMYKKLSLRNPEKITYFANRIQEITLKID